MVWMAGEVNEHAVIGTAYSKGVCVCYVMESNTERIWIEANIECGVWWSHNRNVVSFSLPLPLPLFNTRIHMHMCLTTNSRRFSSFCCGCYSLLLLLLVSLKLIHAIQCVHAVLCLSFSELLYWIELLWKSSPQIDTKRHLIHKHTHLLPQTNRKQFFCYFYQ